MDRVEIWSSLPHLCLTLWCVSTCPFMVHAISHDILIWLSMIWQMPLMCNEVMTFTVCHCAANQNNGDILPKCEHYFNSFFFSCFWFCIEAHAHQHLFKGSIASQQQKDTSLSTGPMERQRKTVMNSSNSISVVLCDMELHCCQKSIKITSMIPRWWDSWHVSGVHFQAVP